MIPIHEPHIPFKRPFAVALLALGIFAALPGTTAARAAAQRAGSAADGPLSAAIAVQPFGTRTEVTVTTSLPTVIHSTVTAAGEATVPPSDAGAGTPSDGGIEPGFVLASSSYVTTHAYTVANLMANTSYTMA